MMDFLAVKQNIELMEIVCGWEGNNSYNVLNAIGRPIYQIQEQTGCCMRNCCGKKRCFNAFIDNWEGHPVHLHRNFSCNVLCCPPCISSLSVTSSSGELYGMIRQTCSIWTSKFDVEDGRGETIFKIKGPCCTSGCFCDVKFPIYSKANGAQIGMISKKWSGLIREGFTDADNFGVSFPVDLEVKMKMVLLAACILIDFMFFESAPKR